MTPLNVEIMGKFGCPDTFELAGTVATVFKTR